MCFILNNAVCMCMHIFHVFIEASGRAFVYPALGVGVKRPSFIQETLMIFPRSTFCQSEKTGRQSEQTDIHACLMSRCSVG